MKRPIFIIIGVILVIILIVIWLFVLFFSDSNNNNGDVFTDLDLGDTDNRITVPPGEEDDYESRPRVDINDPKPLKQLTTKPTAGYQEVQRGPTSTPEVFYIETGTGHIYSIDTMTGDEKRISGTTFRQTSYGEITPNGRFVMLRSGLGQRGQTILGEVNIETESLEQRNLEERIISFAATEDNTFLYAVQTIDSVIAKHYYPISDISEVLFTIPFREVIIDWGNEALSSHYYYPKAASRLEGYLYRVYQGQVSRLPISGKGFSAIGNDDLVMYSTITDNKYQTNVYYLADGNIYPYFSPTLPEKCQTLSLVDNSFICANSFGLGKANTPDAWYQGLLSYSNEVRKIDFFSANDLGVKFLADPEKETGRQLDIINIVINQDDSRAYFTNKTDQTLWSLDLPEPPPVFELEASTTTNSTGSDIANE